MGGLGDRWREETFFVWVEFLVLDVIEIVVAQAHRLGGDEVFGSEVVGDVVGHGLGVAEFFEAFEQDPVEGDGVGAEKERAVFIDVLGMDAGASLIEDPEGVGDVEADLAADLREFIYFGNEGIALGEIEFGRAFDERPSEVGQGRTQREDIIVHDGRDVDNGGDLIKPGGEMDGAGGEFGLFFLPAIPEGDGVFGIRGQIGESDDHHAFGFVAKIDEVFDQGLGEMSVGAEFFSSDAVEFEGDDIVVVDEFSPGLGGIVDTGEFCDGGVEDSDEGGLVDVEAPNDVLV